MVKCEVLAFLLCEKATRGRDGKVTLDGLFDRIIAPRTFRDEKLFHVYYKIVVKEPCEVALKVVHASEPYSEIPGPWRDSLSQTGPIQSHWVLSTKFFHQPGDYVLALMQMSDGSEPLQLASTIMVVDQGE
jgi:hypothetical protein